MDDLRREKALIKNPALATAKKNKAARELSTDAMRKEQIKRNQQSAGSGTSKTTSGVSTQAPSAPSYSAPSAPRVKGIIPTTSNSVTKPVQTTPTPSKPQKKISKT